MLIVLKVTVQLDPFPGLHYTFLSSGQTVTAPALQHRLLLGNIACDVVKRSYQLSHTTAVSQYVLLTLRLQCF